MADMLPSLSTLIREWLHRPLQPQAGNQSVSVHGFNSVCSVGTTRGSVRDGNEDRVLLAHWSDADSNRTFAALLLCDGMGGLENGGECAELVIASTVSALVDQHINNQVLSLPKAILQANRRCFDDYHGRSGATISAVIFQKNAAWQIANIGDSRIYAKTDENSVRQLTIDDTISGQLSALGKTADPSHEPGLLQYVGIGDQLEIKPVVPDRLFEIESLILTSDGAHRLDSKSFNEILRYAPTNRALAQRLLSISEWLGGVDNASIASVSPRHLKDLLTYGTSDSELRLWDPYGESTMAFLGSFKPKPVPVPRAGRPQNSRKFRKVEKQVVPPRDENSPQAPSSNQRANFEIGPIVQDELAGIAPTMDANKK